MDEIEKAIFARLVDENKHKFESVKMFGVQISELVRIKHMIYAKDLKKLFEKIPDNAKVNAYEGEDVGICINIDDKYWWIRCRESDENDDYTEGFD